MPFRLSHADSPPAASGTARQASSCFHFFCINILPPKVISVSPIVWPQRSIYALPAVLQIVEQKGER